MKSFLAILILAGFLFYGNALSAKKYNTVRIGMCTDVHLPTMHDAEYRITTFIDAMKKENPDFSGCIINVSSVSASLASVNRGEYCISKAGIAMATKLWAARLGEFGIPVYEIQPGVIKTDMTAGVPEKYDKLFEQGLSIQQRWGTPEDVGKVAAAMATGMLPYSTGQVVLVDGGMTVQRL